MEWRRQKGVGKRIVAMKRSWVATKKKNEEASVPLLPSSDEKVPDDAPPYNAHQTLYSYLLRLRFPMSRIAPQSPVCFSLRWMVSPVTLQRRSLQPLRSIRRISSHEPEAHIVVASVSLVAPRHRSSHTFSALDLYSSPHRGVSATG